MDLDVVLKSHDCPYIVRCYGTFITQVRNCFLCIHLHTININLKDELL